MSDTFERVAAVERAVREATLISEGAGTDDDAVMAALDRVQASFDALGDPTALRGEVAPARRDELKQALETLAGAHAVLMMGIAREKDGLRDRLLHARTALRAMRERAPESAGARCDVRG